MAEDSRGEDAPISSVAKAMEDKPSEHDSLPVYEAAFHIVPTVPEGEVGSVVEKIRAALGDSEIIKEQFPTKMVLAYTVVRSVAGKREKYNESYFGWIKFATERSALKDIEDTLRNMREVLRFIVVGTTRAEVVLPHRAIFTSDRLEGQTIKKPTAAPEAPSQVSEEELDKSIEALVQ